MHATVSVFTKGKRKPEVHNVSNWVQFYNLVTNSKRDATRITIELVQVEPATIELQSGRFGWFAQANERLDLLAAMEGLLPDDPRQIADGATYEGQHDGLTLTVRVAQSIGFEATNSKGELVATFDRPIGEYR